MSIFEIKDLIENKIESVGLESYAGILGSRPSMGARSPLLWNAAFQAHQLSARMFPLDVKESNLTKLLEVLSIDSHFLGGAIAMPYKEKVASWLGKKITPEARKIGAVNCLYRDSEGSLIGANTDGEAALLSMENYFGSVNEKKILLIGLGGAGKAVATYVASVIGEGCLFISNRTPEIGSFDAKFGPSVKWQEWSSLNSILPEIDLLINCTSVGSGLQKSITPLSLTQLKLIRKSAGIFDIIYDPTPTQLLKLAKQMGFATLNGNAMNLEQAILAFTYASNAKDTVITRQAMNNIVHQITN
jgi:shikimate dehydrogenase